LVTEPVDVEVGVEDMVSTRRLELPALPARRDGLSLLESKIGRHEETRTPDLYRVKVAL
jgi:hypothetical protein